MIPDPATYRHALGPGESPEAFEQRILSTSRQLFSPCGQGEMSWRRWGDPASTPLVLLHGGFGSWRHFALNVLDLAERYCVYAADLPGLGDSAALGDTYSAENVASTVARGLDRILPPDAPFHLCGFSFGGIIGGPVAALQGARTLSYTGVAPGALGLPHGPLPDLASPRPSMTRQELMAVHRRNLQLLMIKDPERVDDLAVHLQYETVHRARARSGDIPMSDTLAQTLPKLARSTRINAIWGDQDVIGGPYLAPRKALFQGFANSGAFCVLRGAGHWVMYERPAEFGDLLLGALADSE